jgi:FMN reductase
MAEPAANGARPLIVGIGGTPREGSSSQRALQLALQAAEDAGGETLLLAARELPTTMYEPGLMDTDELGARLVRAVAGADGLIVSSPGYHGGPSGLIKNALDWTEELREDVRPYLAQRAVGCIACASGWQATTTTLVSLRSIVHALRGWPTPLGVAINSALTRFDADGGVPEPTRSQLEIVGREVVEFALMQRSAAAVEGPEHR